MKIIFAKTAIMMLTLLVTFNYSSSSSLRISKAANGPTTPEFIETATNAKTEGLPYCELLLVDDDRWGQDNVKMGCQITEFRKFGGKKSYDCYQKLKLKYDLVNDIKEFSISGRGCSCSVYFIKRGIYKQNYSPHLGQVVNTQGIKVDEVSMSCSQQARPMF